MKRKTNRNIEEQRIKAKVDIDVRYKSVFTGTNRFLGQLTTRETTA